MLQIIKNSQGSVILRFKIINNSNGYGTGLTGLTSASSGLIIGTIADNEAASTAYTVSGSTIETITTLGTYAAPTATKCRFKEVDSTNHPGLYELQLADARFAVSSAKNLIVSVTGATNAADADFVIPLWVFDPYASVTQTGDNYARLGAPVGASVSADIAAVAALVAASALRSAIGMSSANMDTQLAAIAGYIDTEVGAIKAKTDNLPAAPAAVGDIPTFATLFTSAITESYRAVGAAPTLAQAICELLAHAGEKSVASTVLTLNKLDGATPAETFTLDSATAPTSITRAT
jgi:hypothetical protein